MKKIFLSLIIVLLVGCQNIDNETIINITNETILLTEQMNSLTRAFITYDEFLNNIESKFIDQAAKSTYIDTISNLVVYEDDEGNIYYAKSITFNNRVEYLYTIDHEIKNEGRWYLQEYELSNVVKDDEDYKVLTKITNKMGQDSYFMYKYTLENSDFKISHFSYINFSENKDEFKQFKFEKSYKFNNEPDLREQNIYEMIQFIVHKINDLSKAVITFDDYSYEIEKYFDTKGAFETCKEVAGKYVIGAEGNQIITAKSLNSENINKYYEQLETARNVYEHWYYKGYNISEINSDKKDKVLVKIIGSDNSEINILFTFSDVFPYKIDHVSLLNDRYEVDFKFNEEAFSFD